MKKINKNNLVKGVCSWIKQEKSINTPPTTTQ